MKSKGIARGHLTDFDSLFLSISCHSCPLWTTVVVRRVLWGLYSNLLLKAGSGPAEVKAGSWGLNQCLLTSFSTTSLDHTVSLRRESLLGFSPTEQGEIWLENLCYFNTAHCKNTAKSLGSRCCHLYSNKCFRGHKMSEAGEKKKNFLIRGIYNPGPEPISCPTWGFAHNKWLIGLGLIMQYSSLYCEYLLKNAKNKQALLFLLEIKHFRIMKCYSHDTNRG